MAPVYESLNLDLLRDAIQRVFPPTADGSDESQRAAAAMAALQRLCVITGGPGTGKTFTIAKALALITAQAGKRPVRTLLAAPTGKAAARLRESLQRARVTSEIQRAPGFDMPTDVLTVHRLLKSIPGSPYFRHNRSNPVPADVVIVDEASMVDLALMAKLMDAVPQEARLILVGDKDQLASVEAGSVLGDICDRDRSPDVSPELSARVNQVTGIRLHPAAGLKPGLQDCIIELRKSYRFLPGSGIGELSRAVHRGDADRVLQILSTNSSGSVHWLEPDAQPDIQREIEIRVLEGYRACFEAQTPTAALEAFSRFKILCALKSGPLGVQALNRLAERVLRREGIIEPSAGQSAHWYSGRPILITRNDYSLGLFNGDVGITLMDPALKGGPLFVFFQAASGGIRRFLPYRLPEHETAFAMTVHKSQGSEFDDILLILPDRDSSILTRELIYTALTRSRRAIAICGSRTVLTACIHRRLERASGLRDALWKEGGR
jgi:exodeoxyribonuclease V alpha subunit